MILRELNFPNYKNEKKLQEQNFTNSNFEIFSIQRVWQKFVKLRYLILPKIYSLKVYLWKKVLKNKLLQKQAIIPKRRSVKNESSDANFSKDQANKN